MADKQKNINALAAAVAAGLEKDLGAVSAYAIAVEHGYEGTEEEWAAEMQKALSSVDESAASAQAAKDSADAAAQSAKDAQSAAGEAAAEAAQKAAEDVLPSIEGVISDTVEDNVDGVAIEKTVNGTQFQLDDASGATLRDLKIYGKATQDGTPSSENPVPITVAGSDGSVNVTLAGKNLIANTYSTKTVNGITFTVNEDGSITVNGTASATANFQLIFKPKFDNVFLSGGKNSNLYIQYTNDTNYAFNDTGNGVYIENHFDTETYKTAKIQIVVNSGATINNDIVYPMLNYGQSALPWEPYTGQTFTVSTPNGLPGVPVTFGGNYTDAKGQQYISDVIDCKAKKKTQNCLKQVFNGSENWQSEATSFGYRYFIKFSQNVKNSSDYFDARLSLNSNFPLGVSGSTSSTKNVYTIVNNSIYVSHNGESLEEFKQYLSQNPMTVVAVLETPVETNLSAEEIAAYKALHTNRNITNIFSDTDPQVGMNLTYALDTQKYLDDKYYERVREGKADAIISSVSGENLHVEDASDNGLDNLKIFGKATQEGTPSPENSVPITVAGSDGSVEINFTGKNLCPFRQNSYLNEGVEAIKQSDGSYLVNGTASRKYIVLAQTKITLPKGTYYVTGGSNDNNIYIQCIFVNNGITEYAVNRKFTLSSKTDVTIGLQTGTEIGEINNIVVIPMLNFGDSALSFEAFKEPQTLTIQTPTGLPGVPVTSGGNYTDETGQQYISDVIDCDAKKKTQNNLKVTLTSSMNWSISISGRRVYTTIEGLRTAIDSPILCNYVVKGSWSNNNSGTICLGNIDDPLVGFSTVDFPTAESLKTFLDACESSGNPCYIIAPLAEPVETDLSAEEIAAYKALHTNKTVTNVFSGTDPQVGIQMDYANDTKTYVDNMKNDIQELKAAVLLLQGGNK